MRIFQSAAILAAAAVVPGFAKLGDDAIVAGDGGSSYRDLVRNSHVLYPATPTVDASGQPLVPDLGDLTAEASNAIEGAINDVSASLEASARDVQRSLLVASLASEDVEFDRDSQESVLIRPPFRPMAENDDEKYLSGSGQEQAVGDEAKKIDGDQQLNKEQFRERSPFLARFFDILNVQKRVLKEAAEEIDEAEVDGGMADQPQCEMAHYPAMMAQLIYEEYRGKTEVGHSFMATGCSFKVLARIEVHTTFQSDVQAMVVKNDQWRKIVVVVRGTTSVTDWIVNARFGKADFVVGRVAYGKVHAGFLSHWHAMEPRVLQAARPYLNKDYGLVVTGHSQGGAVGALAAFSLGLQFDLEPLVGILGAPRVGDAKFTHHYRKKVPKTLSMVAAYKAKTCRGEDARGRDLVTMLPPTSIGYVDLVDNAREIDCSLSCNYRCCLTASTLSTRCHLDYLVTMMRSVKNYDFTGSVRDMAGLEIRHTAPLSPLWEQRTSNA